MSAGCAASADVQLTTLKRPALHHLLVGWIPSPSWEIAANALGSVVVGVLVGALVLAAVTLVQRLRGGKPAH